MSEEKKLSIKAAILIQFALLPCGLITQINDAIFNNFLIHKISHVSDIKFEQFSPK